MNKSNSTNFHQIFNLIERVGLLIWFVNAGWPAQGNASTLWNEVDVFPAEEQQEQQTHQSSINKLHLLNWFDWLSCCAAAGGLHSIKFHQTPHQLIQIKQFNLIRCLLDLISFDSISFLNEHCPTKPKAQIISLLSL